MNYEKDIEIDETSLDIEWLEQPKLFMQYSRHLADMRRRADETKQTLDIVRAEIDRDAREDPEKFQITGKVTEGAITSAVLTNDKYKKAYQDFLDAKYEMDMALSAVRAFEQRKDALENLVRLHGQEYFAGPRVPRDLHEEKEKRRKRLNATIANKISTPVRRRV